MTGQPSLWPVLAAPTVPLPVPPGQLRDYQEQALQAVRDAIARGVKRQLIVMATGLGKGHLLGHVPAVVGARKTLVLAHRVEILDQLAGHLRRANPTWDIAVEQGDRREATPDADVIVASVPTLVSAKRRAFFQPDQFDLIMHDESHHIAAQTHVNVLRHFRVHEDDGPLLIGYTATPYRGDKHVLASVFDEIVFDKSLRPAKGQKSPIQEGWLCPVRAIRIHSKTDLEAVPTHGGDFTAAKLEVAVNQTDRNDLIASAIHEHAADRHTILVFATGVDHANALTGRLEADGIETRCVLGTTPEIARRQTWRDFSRGKVRIVVNVGVATEGFDGPRIDCLVMARPTKSPLLFTQMLGRGMRTHPDKLDILVLDVADVCGKHRVQSVSRLFGERDVDLLGQDAETAAAVMAEADAMHVEYEDGDTIDQIAGEIESTKERIREAERRSIQMALEAHEIELFGEPAPEESAPRWSLFPWFQSADERQYVLEIDRGAYASVAVDRLGIWTIRLEQDGKGQVAGENLTHPGARVPDWERADAFVKRHSGHWKPPDYAARNEHDKGIPRWRFMQHEAPRRQRPATEAQIAALGKWKIGVENLRTLTFGRAHDLISAAVWNARHR